MNNQTFRNSNECIGQRIHMQREMRKMTQEQVAEAINITTKYFGQIERGERLLSFFVAEQLCLLFGVTYDYLYLGLERTDLSMLKDRSVLQTLTARNALLNLVLSSTESECDAYLQLLLAALRLRQLPGSKTKNP